MNEQWQELKETIIEMRDNGGIGTQQEVCKFLATYMDNLEKQMQEPRWIPCNERLPKENEYVGDVCKYYLIQDEYGDMHVAHFSNVGWIPMDSLKAIGNEIIAWQELPQPYAESEVQDADSD